MPMDEAELRRTVLDVLKHITTLSSGAIVIASTFADKFPRSGDRGGEREYMVWAFFLLFCSLTTAVGGLMWLEHADHWTHRFICKVSGAMFCFGIMLMGWYAFPLIRSS
jgi:hypothetical protein